MNDVSYYNHLDPVIDTEDDVLAIRKRAMDLYRKGVQVMEWSGEGTTSKKQFTANVEDILRETRYCLKQMNPARYGKIVRRSTLLRLR
jgi:hypothetical protein